MSSTTLTQLLPKGRNPEELSMREKKVLILSALGESATSISKRIGVSPSTVKMIRSYLYDKFGVKSLPELITCAFLTGTLTEESFEQLTFIGKKSKS